MRLFCILGQLLENICDIYIVPDDEKLSFLYLSITFMVQYTFTNRTPKMKMNKHESIMHKDTYVIQYV